MATIDFIKVSSEDGSNAQTFDIGAKAENIKLSNGSSVENILKDGIVTKVNGKSAVDGEITLDKETLIDFIPKDMIGANNGVAPLNAQGMIPATRIPGGIGRVAEYPTFDSFPATGTQDTMYIALDTNKVYRYGATRYVEISEGVILGETSETAYRGDRGKAAYEHAQAKGNEYAKGFYKIQTNAEGHVIAAEAVTTEDIESLIDIPTGTIENIKDDSVGHRSIIEGAVENETGVTKNSAEGNYAHAEGKSTVAGGEGSHAEGISSSANSKGSHASGIGTIANREAQTAIGKYNAAGDYAFVVGNGASNSARSNAFSVNLEGTKIMLGDTELTTTDIANFKSNYTDGPSSLTTGQKNALKNLLN